MNEGKMRVLQMVQDGTITAQEGLDLLEATEQSLPAASAEQEKRCLRIRVTSDKGTNVNLNIPIGLLKIASKLMGVGMAFIPKEAREEMERQGIDLADLDLEGIIGQVEQGLTDGRLIDVESDDGDEGLTQVQIYVD